jgi:hypothetical protein
MGLFNSLDMTFSDQTNAIMPNGSVFIIQSDITKLACDAWLLPCDINARIAEYWWPQLTDSERAAIQQVGGRVGGPRLPPGEVMDSHLDGKLVNEKPNPRSRVTIPVARSSSGNLQYRIGLTSVGAALGTPIDWYVEGARQFITSAKSSVTESVIPRRVRPLFALPVVGTGAGGKYHEAYPVLDALLPTLHHLADDCDIVLVTASEAHYSAALEVQRKIGKNSAFSYDRQIAEIANLAGQDKLVLFFGAGVSVPSGLPDWSQLLDQLAAEAGIPTETKGGPEDKTDNGFSSLNSLDKAQVLSAKFKGDQENPILGQKIAANLRQYSHFSLLHAQLANLDLKNQITTNYDKLFEAAHATRFKTYNDQNPLNALSVIKYDPKPESDRWLLKMHGSVEVPADIVITRENYFRYTEKNAALAGIVQAMLVTKKLLFVGFGLKDENFLRILDSVRRVIGTQRDTQKGKQDDKHGKIGYALMLGKHAYWQELWPEIEFIVFEDASQIELFLEFVLRTRPRFAHYLAPNMADFPLVNKPLKAYRDRLEELSELVGQLPEPLQHKIRSFLVDFGWEG